MVFYDSSWKDCKYNGSSKEAYTMFYEGRKIDHFTHFTGPVSKPSAKME